MPRVPNPRLTRSKGSIPQSRTKKEKQKSPFSRSRKKGRSRGRAEVLILAEQWRFPNKKGGRTAKETPSKLIVIAQKGENSRPPVASKTANGKKTVNPFARYSSNKKTAASGNAWGEHWTIDAVVKSVRCKKTKRKRPIHRRSERARTVCNDFRVYASFHDVYFKRMNIISVHQIFSICSYFSKTRFL